MREKAMPVVGLGDRIPGPVRFLGVAEDDARPGILLIVVAPDVPAARIRAGLAAAGALEPGMSIGGVVDDQLYDDPQLASLRFLHEAPEVLHCAEVGIDQAIIRDVVAVIAAGRGIEGQQPKGRHAQVAQIVQLLGEAGEIPDAVVVAVGEGLYMQLIDDRILEPQLVFLDGGG